MGEEEEGADNLGIMKEQRYTDPTYKDTTDHAMLIGEKGMRDT